MFIDISSKARAVHDEYLRRHSKTPEPLEQPATHGLRTAIGQTLIHLGERLAKVERQPLNKAA